MSAQELSDRTAELGMRVSRPRIAALEGGKRGGDISVPELLVLARALGVPPLGLLYPGIPGEFVEPLPESDGVPSMTTSIAAALWFSGERPLEVLVTDPDGNRALTHWGIDYEDYEEGGRPLRLGRRERRVLDFIERAEAQLAGIRRGGEQDQLLRDRLEEEIRGLEQELEEVRRDQRGAGLTPAPLDTRRAHIEREVG
ncbi:helix-turn-helix transcriptional regulator [Gordonia sp. SCSIO 19800]|uniref:helix-turn-helix domain-containing protein n=1 Tax=Gordonia sp. SCSIO 19800 TaxID=2826926 RepID=UPI001B81E52C|nr:helix-turn-helix transcriptional regulator [Gordonia sp. SCSIO 19800]MBR7191927.1 helix-turn-helix transcriptional regulator [Gordonia sp. SCSIO 19800]